MVARVTRRWVPEIVVFLVLGVLIGPEGPLDLINNANIQSLRLLTLVALGLIIFLLGDRLRFDRLRGDGARLLLLNALQMLLTAALVFAAAILLGATGRLAFVLAVIAAETGVLTVTASVREQRADGPLTDRLLTSVGLTNVIVAAVFGLTFPLVVASSPVAGGTSQMLTAFTAIVVGSAAFGLIGGWVVARFAGAVETSGELLLFCVVVIACVTAAVEATGGSVVVGALCAGVYTSNRAPWVADRAFAAVRTLEAPVYLVFFVVAGAGIHLDELRSLGALGVAYLLARTGGKIVGAMLGAKAARVDVRRGDSLRLGAAMLPHAGMAIALVAFVVEQAPLLAEDVSAVVLGSIVVFELSGPVLLRRALRSVGEANQARVTDDPDPMAVPEFRPLRRIVLPIGSAPFAMRRLVLVLDLAAQLDAEIVALHVSAPPAASDANPDVLTAFQRTARERGIACSIRHRVHEQVAVAIAATVADENADIVIMGEAVRRSILEPGGWGRTTARLVDLVDVPVLVFPIPVPDGRALQHHPVPDTRHEVGSSPVAVVLRPRVLRRR